MKTFLTEKHNIPEGATHYRNECNKRHFLWVKVDGDDVTVYIDSEGEFLSANWLKGGRYIGSVKPIPQVKEAEWVNGLPPVGVECLYAFAGGDYSEWFECEILYVGKQCVFIKTKDENLIKSFGCEELSVEICNTKFRKPETEAERVEREREEFKVEICKDLGVDAVGCNTVCIINKLYELGYRKES